MEQCVPFLVINPVGHPDQAPELGVGFLRQDSGIEECLRVRGGRDGEHADLGGKVPSIGLGSPDGFIWLVGRFMDGTKVASLESQ